MLRILFALTVAAGVASACAKCVPGDLSAPSRCVPQADAGSANCAASEACVAIAGTGVQRDYRCLSPCASGGCPRGFDCSGAIVGSGCGHIAADGGSDDGGGGGKYGDPTDTDGGTCRTLFVCMPTVCN